MRETMKRAVRARRFSSTPVSPATPKSPASVRAKRLLKAASGKALLTTPTPGPEDAAWAPVVGTSTAIEKHYLRLTEPPDPANVRPRPILKKAFKAVKKAWKAHREYHYCCDQLKAIRQDLVVQHVRDRLAARVYEAHARIALEACDLNEFNQCLGAVEQLGAEGVKTSAEEFAAYRLLYHLVVGDPVGTQMALRRLMTERPSWFRPGRECWHAYQVIRALKHGRWKAFFQLYADTPHMGGYLLDWVVPDMRSQCLLSLASAVRFGIPRAVLERIMAYEEDEDIERLLARHGKSVGADGIVKM